jgi:hypothetical protein
VVQATSRRAERTARPGAPLDVEPARPRPGGADGPARGAGAWPHGRSTGSAAARTKSHRPVEASTAAGTAPAARLDRGDKASAAGDVDASHSAGAPPQDDLVLDGQRSATHTWCEVGPRDEGLRIVTPNGQIFRPACKRRDCPRCWARRSRELARCLVLDAREDMPTHCLTLTTAKPWSELEPADYRAGSLNVFRRLRRRYGGVEYFGAVEFTTGKAIGSGGHRRLYGHYLLKFRDTDAPDVIEVERLVRETWQTSTGAYVVEAAELVTPGAALGYLGLHHRKPSQAPPEGWRGMTERASRGYWHRRIWRLREQARKELAAEAIAEKTGMPLELALLEVESRGRGRLIDTAQHPQATLRTPLVGWRR